MHWLVAVCYNISFKKSEWKNVMEIFIYLSYAYYIVNPIAVKNQELSSCSFCYVNFFEN